MEAQHAAEAYRAQRHDRVRAVLERGFFAERVPALLAATGGGGALLDLGCADGLMGRLAGPALSRYVGVDFRPPEAALAGEHVLHDLRDGLGPVGAEPFDCYLASFGVASHLTPAALERLIGEIARHARRGAVVALEALGLGSLEWPRLWETAPGADRALAYRLGSDVEVHPWSPRELAALYDRAGIEPLHALDRSVQAGPKLGESGYWPGLPPLRTALDALLGEGIAGVAAAAPSAHGPDLRPRTAQRLVDALTEPLCPLPAGPTAASHHALAQRRRALVAAATGRVDARGDRGGPTLARAIWALERGSSRGLGHGLLAVGRVR